ncbi:MAG: hypothetical protein JST59_27720 [Actinobacteria bacterium]|nr:hypothetical protein [Actinomycetota bacterium]
MSGTSRVLVVLVVGVLFGAFASTAAASDRVEKAKTELSFSVKGTNGYWFAVTAKRLAGEPKARVTVTAERQRYKVELMEVRYSVEAPMSRRGGFDARFPGLGRIHVSFEQEKAWKTKYPANSVCGSSIQTIHRGTFRGTISFRAEGGFSAADASAAQGNVREDSRRVCKEVEGGAFTGGSSGPKNADLAVAGPVAPAGAPTVSFSATGYPQSEPPTSSGGIPTVAFGASWSAEKRGIEVLALTYRNTVSAYYLVPGPIGTLTDATVTPPAPFAGTGTYHAESPTAATWTGDLTIAFPGTIGTVPLTGPGFTARLCENFTTCTGAPEPTS